jgi:histone-lysine N-methyltransferase SETD3
MLVISRNFGVTMKGKETNIQVPLADMFNTETPKNALWYYDDTRSGFVVEAYADVPKGGQLFDSYGKKCNYRFFLNYAFINLNKDGENPENEFPLYIDLDAEDPHYDVKKEVFLDGMEKTLTEFRVNGHMKEKTMDNFLSWIRFVVFDGDLDDLYVKVTDALAEAKKVAEAAGKKKWGSIGDYVKAIDLHTEIRMWRKIHQVATEALSKYPTTLEEDKALLAKEEAADQAAKTLTYNTRNCVLLRVGEKKILNYLIDTATALVEIGQSKTRKQAIGAMMKQHKILKPSMSYVKGTFIPLIPEEEVVAHDEL